MRVVLGFAAVAAFGCGSCGPQQVKVQIIDGHHKDFCSEGDSAYLAPNGLVAVCMERKVAQFITCATAIGAGEYREESTSKVDVKAAAQAYADLGYSEEQKKLLIARESGSGAILLARAQALDACRTILATSDGGVAASGGSVVVPAAAQ